MAEPMMKCGHAANATTTVDGVATPCCAICGGIPGVGDGYRTVDDSPPDLTGRESRCSYYRPGYVCPDPECKKAPHCPPSTGRDRHAHGGNFPSVAASSTDLPFFSHRPDEDHDTHYCGCWGWD